MNKKKKNRKLIKQNKRNRLINRKYSSTIKRFFKFYRNLLKENSFSLEDKNFSFNNFMSAIDKAVKKRVIHKNSGARKKRQAQKLVNLISKKV
jgi:small subunit ribosomal protein S20